MKLEEQSVWFSFYYLHLSLHKYLIGEASGKTGGDGRLHVAMLAFGMKAILSLTSIRTNEIALIW